jgi:hypothetical protein
LAVATVLPSITVRTAVAVLVVTPVAPTLGALLCNQLLHLVGLAMLVLTPRFQRLVVAVVQGLPLLGQLAVLDGFLTLMA